MPQRIQILFGRARWVEVDRADKGGSGRQHLRDGLVRGLRVNGNGEGSGGSRSDQKKSQRQNNQPQCPATVPWLRKNSTRRCTSVVRARRSARPVSRWEYAP